MSVLLPILASKALALPTSHRIDNAVSSRQNELYIIKVYRNAPRDASVVICLLWCSEFARFLMHNDRRSKTSFSYIRSHASPLLGFTSDVAKIWIIFEKTKILKKNFGFWWVAYAVNSSTKGCLARPEGSSGSAWLPFSSDLMASRPETFFYVLVVVSDNFPCLEIQPKLTKFIRFGWISMNHSQCMSYLQ